MDVRRDPDFRLKDLSRQLSGDKDNVLLRTRYHHALRRLRPELDLSILSDLDAWDQASKEDQDLAVAFCAEKLPGFDCVTVETYHCEGLQHRIATFRHKTSSLDFQLIPGGRFLMGQKDGEDRDALAFYKLWEHFNPSSEQPLHPVRVEKPFLLARFPLTEATVPGSNSELKDSLPLEDLSWSQAQRLLNRIQRGFTLPSEAQWEFACRGQTMSSPQRLFFWGDDLNRDYIWFQSNSDFKRHPQRDHEQASNAFGLIDMLGNVREWCADYFHSDYQGAPKTERPQGHSSGQRIRVMRGGAWNSDAGECRCASRDFRFRRYRQNGAGVRPLWPLDKITQHI